MTTEQHEAVGQVGAAIGNFVGALALCREVDVTPAQALQAIGIDIPGFAAPMVNAQLDAMVDAAVAGQEEISAEGLAS